MNIKKMFTTLSAMVVACAMLLPNASVFAATYSQELQDAYNWAYSKGVTTMSPIDNANMYGAITRAEMAKMLSVYATEVLDMEANTAAACTFSDIDSVKGDLHDYIIESCQLGIMGQGITAFRPYDTISRAEFGTALSRVLWGSQYEGGTPYYAKHLDALKSAGIMNQIANAESTKEIRGYVMLMLMRSEGNDAVVDCDDPMTVIACTTDTDACPAACRDNGGEENNTVVKSGDLALTATAAEGKKVISDGVTSYLDTLTIRVSEDVTVNSITLERYGYSTTADIDKIWLEDSEGNVISSEKSLSPSKDSVTLSLKKDYRTFSNKDTITVAVKTTELDGAYLSGTDEVKPGTNIGFKVTNVECSAEKVDLSDYSAYLYDIINYDGSEIVVQLMGKSGKSYNVTAGEYYEVAKLKVAATNSAIDVNGFTLTNASGLDLSDNIKDVKVKVDGDEVKATYSIKKDTLKVNFDNVNIGIKKNSLFTVSVALQDEFEDYGDKVAFYLENTSDLRATETKNGTTVKFRSDSKYEEDYAYAYTFVGGKVTLTNVKLASSIEAAAGSDGVVIAKGNVSLGGEPINIKSLTIAPEGDAAVLVETIKFFVDDEEYEINKNGAFKDIVIEKDSEVSVVVDLEDDNEGTYSGQTIAFKIDGVTSINATTLKAASENVEYNNSGEPVAKANIAGSITISSIKLNASSAALKNTYTTEAEFVKGQTTTKTIFEGTYTAKKGDVDLNEVALIYGSNPFTGTDSVTINVYVKGKVVATLDANDILENTKTAETLGDNDYVDFSDVTVKAGESVAVKVVADVYADSEVDADEEFDAQKLTLVLRGDDENGNPAGRAKATTAKMKITTSESIKVTDSSAKKTVVLQDSDVVLAQFTVKPSNTSDDVDLTDLELTFSGAFDDLEEDLSVNDLEVTVDDDPVVLDADDLVDGVLTLDGMSYNVPAEGVVVEVRYTAELPAADDPYEVKVSGVNSSSPNTQFLRYVVPVLVKLDQKDMQGSTEFTLNVKKADDSYEITDFELVVDVPASAISYPSEFVDGATIEVLGQAGAQFVTEINYTVDLGDDDFDAEIDKATYGDFFKYGSTYLKVFDKDSK